MALRRHPESSMVLFCSLREVLQESRGLSRYDYFVKRWHLVALNVNSQFSDPENRASVPDLK